MPWVAAGIIARAAAASGALAVEVGVVSMRAAVSGELLEGSERDRQIDLQDFQNKAVFYCYTTHGDTLRHNLSCNF